jgi:hypothetical protein
MTNNCFAQCTSQYYGYATQDAFAFTPTASPAGCTCANLNGKGKSSLVALGVSRSSTAIMNFWWQISKNAETDQVITMT